MEATEMVSRCHEDLQWQKSPSACVEDEACVFQLKSVFVKNVLHKSHQTSTTFQWLNIRGLERAHEQAMPEFGET